MLNNGIHWINEKFLIFFLLKFQILTLHGTWISNFDWTYFGLRSMGKLGNFHIYWYFKTCGSIKTCEYKAN